MEGIRDRTNPTLNSGNAATNSTILIVNCATREYMVLCGVLYSVSDEYSSDETALPSRGTISLNQYYSFFGTENGSTTYVAYISVMFSALSSSSVKVSDSYCSNDTGRIWYHCLY